MIRCLPRIVRWEAAMSKSGGVYVSTPKSRHYVMLCCSSVRRQ